MGKLFQLFIVLGLSVLALPAFAQLTLEEIESSAPAESERIQKVIGALENPDPDYRMHAFRFIMDNGSDYERRLAMQRAFLGTDLNLRNAALKERLAEMPVFRLELQRPKSGDDAGARYFGPRESAWIELDMELVDRKAGLFKAEGREAFVIDDQFMVSFWPGNLLGICHVELGLADDLSLEGPVNCERIPATMARAPLF